MEGSTSIKKKVFSGLVWTYAERFLAQSISIIVTVVLSRMIEPEEYGVIAIVTVFITFADTFAINGLGNALIQKKNADDLDFSSVFYFNIIFSMLLYFIIFEGAPFVAYLYKKDILTIVLRVMAIRIPIAAVNSVQQAYVSKIMEFKKFFYATLFGTLFSAVIGVIMATRGFGVWALVSQYMSNTIIDTLVLWKVVGWRPKRMFSWKRMKTLYSYGWKILATSLLINIYGNIQDLIIGKKFSAKDLAFSNKGRQFPSLIADNINTSISKVLFPAISEVQTDRKEVKKFTRRAISVGTYILSPILVGLAVIAKPFVEIILTDKWLPSVPYLRIMCLVFLLQPIQTASIQAMKAIGESETYLKLEIIKKAGGVLILFISIVFFRSVFAIVLGGLITEIFSTIMNIPTNKRLIEYTYFEQIEDVGITFLITTFMAIIVSFTGHYIFEKHLQIIVEIFVGIVTYMFLSIIIKNNNYVYLRNTVDSIVRKRRGK
jgi:hypothetical protein